MSERFDVVVVGSGNAGFSAAHAAAQRGRSVVVLEKQAEIGGNSYFTAGATRITHAGLDDLRDLVESDERHERTEVPPYTRDDYLGDLNKVTEGRTDPMMAAAVADEAHEGLRWLHDLGLKYRLMYERQAYRREDGSYLFWGGLHVGNVDGGKGLIRDHIAVAQRLGIEVRASSPVTALLTEGDRVTGVRVGDGSEIHADSVVVAAGGFEANPKMREEYLGTGWQNAKVRGTQGNTGELLTMALDLGAAHGGDWLTCHSVQWDAYHPHNESNLEFTNQFTRQSYPLGIIVNREGHRFLDEGADFRNLTYAKYGRVILAQPGSVAFQVFDADLRPLLRPEEYEMPGVSEVVADSIPQLAAKLGIDEAALESTVRSFNESIDTSVPLDANVKDGRRADTEPPKSNWSSPLARAPFYAYPVTCGITFTFGGLRGDRDGRVLREDGTVIDGLLACGEALGGLFSGNYPGGSGLAAGVVFGRRAGNIA